MPGYELIGDEEKASVLDVFDKSGGVLFAHGFDNIRNGSYRVRDFETLFKDQVRSRYALAVTSGTAALKVALKAAGIKPGDEVITQSFTFIATVEAIMECGAVPIIVNVDDTLTMNVKEFESVITSKTKAVIPVHMMGCAADMESIMIISKKYKLKVIEDSAWGCGASFRGQPLGTFGDFGCFSFDAGKVITSGEGGMVVTSDHSLFVKARAYHDHGHEYSMDFTRADENAILQGFNYRMTELQAAVGLAQLAKLDQIVIKQRLNKTKIWSQLKVPVTFQRLLDKDGDNANSLIFFCESNLIATKVVDLMKADGLGTKNLPDALKWHFSGFWSHLYENHPQYKDDFQNRWGTSRNLLNRAVAIPINVKMTDDDITKVVDVIHSAFDKVLV